MNSGRLPALFALVGVVVAVGLFLVLKDDTADEDTTIKEPATTAGADEDEGGDDGEQPQKPEKPEVPVIEIQGGQPVGGVRELEVTQGEEIRFIVESDVDEEVHLHGYDVSMDVEAGGMVEFRVQADDQGLYEVELEHSVVPIAEISVVPG